MTELKPCPACGGEAVQIVGYRIWIECEDCECCGPTESALRGKAGELWNSLPRRPRWTTEPPTVPGWYWSRHALHPREAAIVYLTRSRLEPIQKHRPVDEQWAGPIPMPEDG